MGEIIRKNAQADDIMADVGKTVQNAIPKEGVWQSIAEEKLAPAVKIYVTVNADLKALRDKLAPLQAIVENFDQRADKFIGEKSDEIWNSLGRPGNDPGLSLLFPGGILFYTSGSDEEQPDRMDLLAELLEAGVHARLRTDLAKKIAGEVRDMAAEYRKKLEPVLPLRTRIALLEKVKDAIARSAQMELARAKRRWLSEGFSEAEIHTVIPDRPASRPQPKT